MSECKHKVGDEVAMFSEGRFVGRAFLEKCCGDEWLATLILEGQGLVKVDQQSGAEMVACAHDTQPLKDRIAHLEAALEEARRGWQGWQERAEALEEEKADLRWEVADLEEQLECKTSALSAARRWR